MKFSCELSVLSQAVSKVMLAVSSKSSLAALEGILLSAAENNVSLVGYNLEMGVTTEIQAFTEEDGKIIIPAKYFCDIIRKLEGDRVTISCDKRSFIEITAQRSHFSILGMPAEEFPELPELINPSSVSLPSSTFRSMVNQVLFAVSKNDAKPVQMGALFSIGDGDITVVAVDGVRLALRKEKANIEEKYSFNVPGKTLSELLKIIGDDDEEIVIRFSKKHIVFEISGCSVISRLLEGEFLNYQSVIPKDSAAVVKVGTRDLISSIERTSLLIADKAKNPLKINFTSDTIKINCTTSIGKAYDECPCQAQGKEVEMGFNSQYLLDALRYSETDMVKFEINGPLSPIKVVPMDGDSFLFLVLPVRLRAE